MQPDQRRCFPFLEVAVHGIADLLVQLLQAVCLGMDGRSHSTGPVGAVIGLLYDKQDLVHGSAS